MYIYVYIYVDLKLALSLVATMAPKSKSTEPDIVQYQAHCVAFLASTRRRFDHKVFGGEEQANAAAKQFVSLGQTLLDQFDSYNGKPSDRKTFLVNELGCCPSIMSKSIAKQRASVACMLIGKEVKWFEADIMEVAVRATPGIVNPKALSITFDSEATMFRARIAGDKEMSQTFLHLADARTWTLHMGKSSEASTKTCMFIYMFFLFDEHVFVILNVSLNNYERKSLDIIGSIP